MPKTILITGATDGLGLETARSLSQDGHRLLLHGRSADKLARAAAAMSGPVQTYSADLSDLEAVEIFAAQVIAAHDHLDVLINNAGVYKTATRRAATGEDIRFLVNTVAPYLLTHRLLPLLGKTGRVVNLSSAAQARMDLDALAGARPMDAMAAYAQSKLGITIWTRAMAEAHPDGPAFFAVNPGSLLATKMVKEGFGMSGNNIGIGVDILKRVALSDEFAGRSGAYFDNDSGRFAALDPAAQDPSQVNGLMDVLAGYLAGSGQKHGGTV